MSREPKHAVAIPESRRSLVCPLSVLDLLLGGGTWRQPQELFPSGIGEPADREGETGLDQCTAVSIGGAAQGPVNAWTDSHCGCGGLQQASLVGPSL